MLVSVGLITVNDAWATVMLLMTLSSARIGIQRHIHIRAFG